MEDRYLVVAALPSRREELASVLRSAGHASTCVADLEGQDGPYRAVMVDAGSLAHVPAAAALGPVLVVGADRDREALSAALEAGAADLTIDATPQELLLRVQLLAARAGPSRQGAALLELAAAAGASLEPTTVLRAILGWLTRSLPGVEAEVVLAAGNGNGNVRTIARTGAGLSLGQEPTGAREEVARALAGEKLARSEAGGNALAVRLEAGRGPVAALSLRSNRPFDEQDLRFVQAAAALASQALRNARAHDMASRERERLETEHADRYRQLLEANRKLRELSRQNAELIGLCTRDLAEAVGRLEAGARELGADSLATEARRARDQLEDVAAIHAIETGEAELQRAPLDVGRLVREVAAALATVAAERSVQLHVEAPPSGPSIVGDAGKLGDVVAGLVGNAIRFSPPGSTARVQVSMGQAGGARIEVEDSGPGIPAEALGALMSGSAQPRGGLGLLVAREITALHGGRLVAESEVGRGSTFVVELPGTAAEKPPVPRLAAEAGAPERPLLLVVEDDPDLRALLEDVLSDEHEVIGAPDGETGVRLAKEKLPAAVLMDLFLPGMDGFAALEELKQDPITSEIPVVFLSGQRDPGTRVRGLDLGADDFLAKPFSATELRARIDKALRTSRQRKELEAIARTDALTGLPNYRAFRDRLEEEVERSRRYHIPLAAMMLDLDGLKLINDRLGHAAGNRAIEATAATIRAELRLTDFAARYGGDEFVVLLPHTGASEAAALAERLRRAIRRTPVEGVNLRSSFGVAALPGGAEAGPDALLAAADAALYRAKHTGRDRVCIAGQESEEVAEQAAGTPP